MDFALILVILSLVSGIIWGLEVAYRRLVRRDASLPPSDNVFVEYSRSFFPVLILVLVVMRILDLLQKTSTSHLLFYLVLILSMLSVMSQMMTKTKKWLDIY